MSLGSENGYNMLPWLYDMPDFTSEDVSFSYQDQCV